VDYQDHLLQARTLSQAGQASEAGKAYRKAIALEPRPQMPVSREVADAAFAANELEQARVLYQAILEANEQDRPVRQRLIETAIRLERLDQAQQLLAGVDQDDATYSMLASLLTQKRGDIDQALQMLGQAIRRYPEDARLYHARGRLLATNPATLTQAMGDVRNALSRNPDLDDARQLLVQIYLERGEVELASRELRQLLTRQPDSHNLRLQLLNLHINRRDLDAARRLVEVAQERQPQEVLWPLWQSRIARLAGNTTQAIGWLEQAVVLQPNPDIIAELVTLRLDQGEARQAHQPAARAQGHARARSGRAGTA